MRSEESEEGDVRESGKVLEESKPENEVVHEFELNDLDDDDEVCEIDEMEEDAKDDSDDEYAQLRRVEEAEVEAEIAEEKKEDIVDSLLQSGSHLAKEQNDPSHHSYWKDPVVDLIDVRNKKRFFNQGV